MKIYLKINLHIKYIVRIIAYQITIMKIIKSHTSQTSKVTLLSNGTVSVFDFNDSTYKFEFKYSIPGDEFEYQMQLFFNLK